MRESNHINRTILKKVVSVVTSVIMFASYLSLPDLTEDVKDMFLEVSAATSYDVRRTIKSLEELYQFSADYQSNPGMYYRNQITININGNIELSHTKVINNKTMTWYPLGTAAFPFGGELIMSTTTGQNQNFAANEPLFDYIYDTVAVVNTNDTTVNQIMNFERSTDVPANESKPLFANHVVHDPETKNSLSSWDIIASGTGTYSGIIGTVGTGSDKTTATLNLTLNSSANIVSNSTADNKDAGIVCGVINKGSTVNVNLASGTGTINSVTSTGGNAGGFAGTMNENSSLNIYTGTSGFNVSSANRTIEGKTYSGGLVGYNDRGTVTIKAAETDENEAVYTAQGNVYADTSDGVSGGVFGYYKVPAANNKFSPTYYKTTTQNSDLKLKGKTAGGLVGMLEGNGLNISYCGTTTDENAVRVPVKSTLSAAATNYGGIIGIYNNTDLKKTLTVKLVDVRMANNGAVNYGGVVGSLSTNDDTKAEYVNVDEFTMTSASGADKCTNFGGVVGSSGNKGSLIDVGTIKVTVTGAYKGGGVVGQLNAGVLRLSGTTDLSSAKANSGGQIVGERTNALVYALGSGNDTSGNSWCFVRSSDDVAVDDIGTWGEVVRISDVETKDPAQNDDLSDAILVYDSTEHTVTVRPAKTDMRSVRDVVRTALNMQLNDGNNEGALCFVNRSESKRDTLLANRDLTVWGTISLSGTGITGFMRDGYFGTDTEIKLFTGKLSKGAAGDVEDETTKAVINLAVGERYGVISNNNNTYSNVTDSNSTGRGVIHGHKFNGLFARTGGGAEIENITVGGYMNINAKIDDIYIGGAIAYLNNNAKITAVNASETINYNKIGGSKHFVGGLIGTTNCGEGKNVEISGASDSDKATISPTINVGTQINNKNNDDATVEYQAIGGLIGYISSTEAASTTIENITLSATIDASSATAVANVSTAGLIADIKWNNIDTRTLVLNKIDVTSTSVKNTATNTTGGILGYRWFGTDVTFDDVTLTTGDSANEINTNAAYIGGLVYKATGHWTVNNNGIVINSIAFKNANATATATPTGLGIIVLDGYYSNNGLFLELNAVNSYSLATGLSNIPDMSGAGKIYDELCACLSKDQASLLTNNTAGVISYYTSDGLYTSADEEKNSYNNKYNVAVVNNRSRYYYNADIESYTNNSTDAGYKLLYWSLNRYAAANIKHCFTNPFTNDVLTGTFDLKNISYYPIDISKNVTIGDATFVFYNSEIEDSEMSADTKRSTRDGKSQHYTMHMGLFRNVSATITTTGNITLYGSVGVDNSYSGALINGTLTGTLNTAAAKNIYIGDANNQIPLEISDINKFLFINKIGDKAVLNLNGLYINGSAYEPSDDTTYASSLIGDVQGAGINLTFNNIKIDGRKKENVTITNGNKKNGNYSTDKSIFSNATLLNKLDVDSTSVAVYNFSQKEDWGSDNAALGRTSRSGASKVTFGRELTDSVEYKDEENRYYENGENGNYIAPVTYPGKYDSTTAPLGTAYDFGSDYLPYVRYFTSDTTKITNPPAATYTLREIKVNVVPSDLKDGCGAYDHPYSITSAKQLAAVSAMLDYKNSAANALIPNVMLPETNNRTHWCSSGSTGTGAQEKNTDSCLLFTYDTDLGKYKHVFTTTSTDPDTGVETTTVIGTAYWEINDVRKYLASAYYQIGNSIVLTSTFTGLGAYDSEYAFKGVIVGLNNNITVTNTTTTPFIKVSNGSVVKGLKINVSAVASSVFGTNGSNTTVFNYSSNALFYGGVIGKIMGGDNIIDNVSITYSNSGFIKTQNQSLMCVGGYVGVIVNGGLVFRNMSSGSFTNKSNFKVNASGASTEVNWVLDENNTTAHGHLFVNPYVGRVINGYAINETTGENARYSADVTSGNKYTLDNGTKNYQIADVNADVSEDDSVTNKPHKLYYDKKVSGNDRVNIPDGQALFMLSLITQSGAGTATTADGAYAYAIGYDGNTHYGHVSGVDTSAHNAATHLADYDEVGSIKYSQKTTGDYATAVKDKYNVSTAVPYIIYHYTKADTSGNYPARKMTGGTDFMKLSKAGGTYNLPESFRGIGSICDGMAGSSTTNPYQMHIYGFDGNGATINEQIIFNTYSNTNDNYANKVYGSNNINLGMGLFNVLVQKPYSDSTTYNLDDGYYIGNFTLTGQVTVKEYTTGGVEETGGFSTNDKDQNNAVYRSRYAVGGVTAGLLPSGYANFYNLDLDRFNVTGTSFVGAYIGRNNITEVNAQNGNGSTKTYVNGCDTTATKVVGSQGCSGGIMGGNISGYPSIYVNTAKVKTGDTHTKGSDGYYKSTMQMSITNNATCSQGGIGAVIGTVRNGYGVNLWVNNLVVEGYGTTGFSNNSTEAKATWTAGAGGLFGFVRKANSVIVTNCEIKNLSVKAPLAGGMFGNIDFYDDNGGYGTSPVIKIANCKITSDSASTYSIEGIKGAGGITGQFTSSKAYDKTVVGYDEKNYNYDVDGCEVSGYTISQTGNANELCGAGGLFGFARATYVSANDYKMRTVVNTSVHDCIIKTDGTYANHGMGAVVGCVPTINSDTSNSAKIVIDDSENPKSTAKACGNVGAYNIACYNNTFSFNGEGTNAKYGNFVGQSNSSTFKIVGFTRKNNKFGTTAFAEDYGGDVSEDSYIIDADYMNVSTTTDAHGNAMSPIKKDDTVVNVGEGAAKLFFPYVTVSPKIAFGGSNFLTGDGISLYNNLPLAKLITTENGGTAADNRIAYKTVSDDDITIVNNMLSATDPDIKLTTYFSEMGRPTGYEGSDFPIIAINGGKDDYNQYINAYIRTLTNTNDAYSTEGVAGKFVVDIYPCRCISGVYQKVSVKAGTGLQLDNGYYIMKDQAADSIAGQNQITMIDIRFLDPTDSSKTAYHLYVPVLTKKMLKFKFSSSALQGTEYEPSVYRAKFPSTANTNSKLAASFDSWQTVFVQFDYTKNEVNEFLKTGKGLDWNTSKMLYFKYNGDKSLATSTQFVLLDNNNNADKEYYITKASITTETDLNKYDVIKFDDFKTTRDKASQIAETPFAPQKLNDIAGTKVVCSIDTKGAYVQCSDQTNHSDSVAYVYDSNNSKIWFRPYSEGDTGDRYKLEVTGDISETYYLSMYTYSKDNVITETTHNAYGFVVESPMTFTSDVITCQREEYKNTEVYLGNFLKQTLIIDRDSLVKEEKISPDNHILTATLKATLEFDGDNIGYFHDNLGGEKIYQGFLVYLNRYNEDGEPVSDCTIKGMPEYSYTCKLGDDTGNTVGSGLDEGEPYLYIEPIEIEVPDSSDYKNGATWKSNQEVAVKFDFSEDEGKLRQEFPQHTADGDLSGIRFDATAKLDFVSERVPYSNIVLAAQNTNQITERYYIDRSNETVKLTLTAIDQTNDDEYDPYGEQSHNKSALGINAKYINEGSKYSEKGDTEHIKIGMDFDVSVLPDETLFDGNHELKLTIKLYQKNNLNSSSGFKYDPVSIMDYDSEHPNTGYLENFKIFGQGTTGQLSLTDVRDGGDGYLYYTYTMELPEDKQDMAIKYTENGALKQFNANVEFDVKTASKLEAITGYKYANYKFEVNAEIIGATTTHSSKDHIIYTNAKVNAQYVKKAS